MINPELHSQPYRRAMIQHICAFIRVGDTANASELLEEYLNYWRDN